MENISPESGLLATNSPIISTPGSEQKTDNSLGAVRRTACVGRVPDIWLPRDIIRLICRFILYEHIIDASIKTARIYGNLRLISRQFRDAIPKFSVFVAPGVNASGIYKKIISLLSISERLEFYKQLNNENCETDPISCSRTRNCLFYVCYFCLKKMHHEMSENSAMCKICEIHTCYNCSSRYKIDNNISDEYICELCLKIFKNIGFNIEFYVDK